MIRLKFRKFRKFFTSVKVMIRRSHSNVFVAVSGRRQQVFKTFSAGLLGFKNTKKDTPYAAESVGKAVGRYLVKRGGRKQIALVLLSPLDGRVRAVLRGIGSFQKHLKLTSVRSRFSPAHNGCRAKKIRRA